MAVSNCGTIDNRKDGSSNILYILLVAFLFCGCTETVTNETIKRTHYVNIETEVFVRKINSVNSIPSGLNIITIDNCEYITYSNYFSGTGMTATITHKGNCKYCAERSKK